MTGVRPVIALDTVVLIYALEQHPAFGAAAAAHLRRIESGAVSGGISVLVLTELLPPYFERNDTKAARQLEVRLQRIPNLTIHDVSPAIAVEAARLRTAYRLRTPDALHAATALTMGAKSFVTHDLRLARLQGEGLAIETL